jgi:hydrogenase maturation protease
VNEWEWQLLEDKAPVESVNVGGVELKPGDQVRLRPRKGGDIFDLALAGQLATIEAIEQDYEGQFQLAVVVDIDPGRDMGLKRQPGHRFFFLPEEVEPVVGESKPTGQKTIGQKTILIAGIGNIFLGDDAFGVEVVKQLSTRVFPDGVRVVDYGIRGFDLAYALMDGPDVTILVDACPRGGAPGTVYVIEPDLANLDGQASAPAEGHSMNPVSVLRMASSMGGKLKSVLLVGCEPEFLGGDEGHMGLSASVEAAVAEAAATVESLVQSICAGDGDIGKGFAASGS